ncbi:MAG: hypothetical protein ACRD4U_10475 [Candidatus Acidiferrales bacterium]
MIRRNVVFLIVGVLALSLAGSAWSKGKPGNATTLNAVMSTSGSTGVYDDGDPNYNNGASGVQVYFGVGGKDLDLVTYDTGRTMRFVFDQSSSVVQAAQVAGLPVGDFNAEMDFFGINYWGRYREMTIGATAQVQADLEFHTGGPMPTTFELEYPSLAVMRVSETEWLVTSDPADIPGDPGFQASSTALLNIIRRRKQTSYGIVDMPLRFTVTVQ